MFSIKINNINIYEPGSQWAYAQNQIGPSTALYFLKGLSIWQRDTYKILKPDKF